MLLNPTKGFAFYKMMFVSAQCASRQDADRLTVLEPKIAEAGVRYLAPSQEAESFTIVSATRALTCT